MNNKFRGIDRYISAAEAEREPGAAGPDGPGLELHLQRGGGRGREHQRCGRVHHHEVGRVGAAGGRASERDRRGRACARGS